MALMKALVSQSGSVKQTMLGDANTFLFVRLFDAAYSARRAERNPQSLGRLLNMRKCLAGAEDHTAKISAARTSLLLAENVA